MKTMILILTMSFLFAGCVQEDPKENVITENDKIYYYFDAGFGTSQCNFVIEINDNQVYIPNNDYDLSEFVSNDENYINNVKVSFKLTQEEKIVRCFHKEGFLENPTEIIEIVSIEKL